MRASIFALCVFTILCTVSVDAVALNKVAAVVNGQMISEYDVQMAAKPDLRKAGLSETNPAQRKEVKELYGKVLEGMIMDILLGQEAERLKVTVSDAEVEEEISRVMQQSKMPKEAFEKQLKSEGLTPAMLRDRVRKTLLRQRLMGMQVGRKVVVTPKEIEEYYNSHKEDMHTPRTLRMALLVYHPKAPAKQFAEGIKIKAISFEEAVKRASIGPNREKGGEVEPVQMDKLNPEWRKRLGSMKVGDVSPLFSLQGRQAQVKLLSEPMGGEPLDLAAATPMVENILREPRLKERFEEYIDQLRKKAMIDVRMQ